MLERLAELLRSSRCRDAKVAVGKVKSNGKGLISDRGIRWPARSEVEAATDGPKWFPVVGRGQPAGSFSL